MFVGRNTRGGYTRDGEQHASGRFLILLQTAEWIDGRLVLSPIRAIVRYARMHQCGHFMMGAVTIAGHRVPLSGAYGGDGLPRTVPPEVYAKGVDVPPDLVAAWNRGGGWNSAGSEAPDMRAWALSIWPDRKGGA